MERRATIIYNPLAGPADFAETMALIADHWRRHGWRMHVVATEAVGHATALAARAAAEGDRVVLATGGDGTLGEVANGLAGSRTIMGLLPSGTANSFARELGIPLPGLLVRDRLVAVAAALLEGRVFTVDLGHAAYPDQPESPGRYWLLWTGAGADGHLVHELEPRPKWSKHIGRASYVLRGIPAISNFSHVRARVDVDGEIFDGDYVLVLVSNCRRYAGGLVTLSENAFLDDGKLEVWLFSGRGLPSISRHALRALQGQLLQDPEAILLSCRRVAIYTDAPMPLQMDGDPAGVTPVVCEIRPQALRLLIPPTAPDDLFRQEGRPLATCP